MDTITVWDSLYWRPSAAAPWTKASLGVAVSRARLDANPLTLVDRLRVWLGAPGRVAPTVTTVVCSAPSGTCREIHLDAGVEPARVLDALLPGGHAGTPAPVETRLTLLADTATLRPVHLELALTDPDGTVSIRLIVDASGWDQPSVIAEPPTG